ncbi:dynein axonemal intermediate chain 2 isoform X1 [Pieris rapae]|uniref:dynein axonemal intermediate chain 2 isoform X1 n=2 Tax=Pieris rapae TaxID=64459 RepID=UPI001E281419|nr:dynein axonemal intermediate chain 2 isoform X1 [Pieris rapae]XP_045485861.1 dynein axonemal intermediate chain 2 isoform X1 [Pieris rapae]
MEITFSYTKKRCEFGRQPLFCEQGPELCDSVPPNTAEHKHYILRNPVHQPTQNTPCFSEHHVNTIRAEYSTTGANHAEGGWPKDVNVVDPEATQRYRRKIEKDDNYIHCVMSLAPGMDHYVLQNNAIDMYRTYYAEMATLPQVERNSCRTVNVYRDPMGPRPIAAVSWQPEGGQRFAVAYLDVDFNRLPRASLLSYIWDVENANDPEVALVPPVPLLDLQFNPRERNILAGGLLNGQVGIWDRRRGGVPVVLCAPHVAHRDLVRNVIFINSKSGQEFFSGGPDGACKWWDIRNMDEPTDEMIIDVVQSSFDVQSMANANGISVMEYEPTIPTRFMVGTDNGLVVGGNRKGKTPMEKLPAKYEAHVGPVWSLERNPGFLKNFLTVGDWTMRVWSEDCRESAVLWSPPNRHKITAATWSPTRLSLVAAVQWDGLLATWDLLRRQHEPTLTMHVCDEPLLRLRMHEGGAFVACGSRKGNIYMVEYSQNMTQSDKNDKLLLTAMFERESKRERILEARMREIRLKLRQAEEGSPAASVTEFDPSVGDRDLAEATSEYMQGVKKELAAM